MSTERHRIAGKPGALYYVAAVNELEDAPLLEKNLLGAGYDGYLYALVNCDDQKEIVTCAKSIGGDFVELKK